MGLSGNESGFLGSFRKIFVGEVVREVADAGRGKFRQGNFFCPGRRAQDGRPARDDEPELPEARDELGIPEHVLKHAPERSDDAGIRFPRVHDVRGFEDDDAFRSEDTGQG